MTIYVFDGQYLPTCPGWERSKRVVVPLVWRGKGQRSFSDGRQGGGDYPPSLRTNLARPSVGDVASFQLSCSEGRVGQARTRVRHTGHRTQGSTAQDTERTVVRHTGHRTHSITPQRTQNAQQHGTQDTLCAGHTIRHMCWPHCTSHVLATLYVTCASLDWMKLWVCSAFFYNFLFIYWSMISFVLRIQIGIDLYIIIDKALYW